jgi:hypothetical protein
MISLRSALAVVAIALTACGTARVAAQQTTATPTPAPPDKATEADRLSTPITYEQGVKRFDPPPADVHARRSRDGAYKAYTDSGDFPDAPKRSNAVVRFALYTDNGLGTADEQGNIVRKHVRQPVWMIAFDNIRWSDQGPGSAAGDSRPQPTASLHQLVIVVDDATGKLIIGMLPPGPD